VISVSELTKSFGYTLAVDRISFEVPKGQIVGFLGPNGAGKSTTLRMLTCYLPPTSGTATVAGFDIFHDADKVRSNLGYLPENCPLYGEMKVAEYLEFRGQLRGMERKERQRRIEYVIDRCWLDGVRRKSIAHLSKGFKQRVGLADALMHNPPVLIMDEPTIGLDPNQIRETRKLIRDLAGQHTVMLSTHILPEVSAVCDHVVVIAGGRIVAQGSVEDLIHSRRSQARVLVECRGPSDEVKAALGRLAGVATVDVRPSTTDKQFVTAALRAREGYDIREEVARAVISHGWPMRELRLEQATLEEFFVQVTANQAMAPAAQGGVA
jgi:ABC-2 type transport system ATP-binding protein